MLYLNQGEYMNTFIKEDQILQLDIKRMGINGEGIGYDQKLAIFVDHALPGETVSVKVKEVLSNRATAEILEIIEPSFDRVQPFCPIFEKCGGCQTQHIDYQAMLIHKRDILIKSFARYAGLIDFRKIKKTIGSSSPLNYRNKATLPVQMIKGKNTLGMYARNSNQFIPLDECPVQDHDLNRILKTIIKLMDAVDLPAFDPKKRSGYIRHLVVRVTKHTREAQVTFILLRPAKNIGILTQKLVEMEPMIKGVFEVINSNLKSIGFFTGEIHKLYGTDTIDEELRGMTYSLRPEAFFQLNTEMADKFYLEMKRLARMKPHEIAIDAYAGIAPVSHYIHDQAKQIYAIELDQESCESAKISLQNNNIQNVTVLHSDFKRALSGLKEKKIDVMFFDPPRTGLGDETIELIIKSKPSRLIYGSCNPSTLAKDLSQLLKYYDLIECVPIDMFPYTSLVESVSLLTIKS